MNNIAIFGYGTVGRGVKELAEHLNGVKVTAVFDLPSKKEELGNLLVTDAHKIINDEGIDTVIECLGGDSLSYKVISESLKNHKNVISSNKETISKHLKEYVDLANENKVSLQFEASVGGGIPLICPLEVQSQFYEISSIRGILNGTSNFILTKMSKDKMGFKEAVDLAISKGLAEKDPSADLQGLDMVRKGCILASLVTKREIHNEDIIHFGIENINSSIIDCLSKKQRVLKLVTDIKFSDKGVSIIVLPCALSVDDPLSRIDNENNMVEINGKFNEPIFISGKGAGRYPTASAIVQDLIRVMNKATIPLKPLGTYLKVTQDLKGNYVGFDSDNKPTDLINPTIDELNQYKLICRME